MASIKLSPLLQTIRGSIGGATFQRSRSGHTLRKKPLPLYSAKPNQLKCRAYMMQVHYAWQSLTQTQRNFWIRLNLYVTSKSRRDYDIPLIAHELYLKYQFLRLLTGQSLLTSFKLVPMPAIPVSWYLYRLTTYFYFMLPVTIDSSALWFVLKLSYKRLATQNYNSSGIKHILIPVSSSNIYNFAAAYLSVFGALPAAGSILHYEITWFSQTTPFVLRTQKGTTTIV